MGNPKPGIAEDSERKLVTRIDEVFASATDAPVQADVYEPVGVPRATWNRSHAKDYFDQKVAKFKREVATGQLSKLQRITAERDEARRETDQLKQIAARLARAVAELEKRNLLLSQRLSRVETLTVDDILDAKDNP